MDGNPAHSSKGTQVWLKNKLTEVWEKETWPPSSPDCDPFDYYAAGVSELRVRANPQKKNQRPDPLHQGGNGVPRQERRGEVPQEVQVPEQCCRRF
jgi:hypothetical protein